MKTNKGDGYDFCPPTPFEFTCNSFDGLRRIRRSRQSDIFTDHKAKAEKIEAAPIFLNPKLEKGLELFNLIR